MRREIKAEIQRSPGIHFRQLKRNLGCSTTTINYHIDEMDVREIEIHSYRRLYPSDVPESMEKPLAALNHEMRGPILFHVSKGKSASELAEELEISSSTVSNHLNLLEKDGLIEKEKEGRRKTITLNGKAVIVIREYASQLLDQTSEGFIDMWE